MSDDRLVDLLQTQIECVVAQLDVLEGRHALGVPVPWEEEKALRNKLHRMNKLMDMWQPPSGQQHILTVIGAGVLGLALGGVVAPALCIAFTLCAWMTVEALHEKSLLQWRLEKDARLDAIARFFMDDHEGSQ